LSHPPTSVTTTRWHVEEDGIENNFPANYRTRETADLFLVLIMRLLKNNGRAAMVLPDGMLFGEGGVKTRIKEDLLKQCNLHTIVRLPNGVFNPYTGIKTNLLFFNKGRPTESIWYYEHPYPPGVKSYNKTRPMRIEEFDAEKAWWYNREETPQAWQVPIEDIRARNYNLDISNPNAEADSHRPPEHLLAEYQAATEALTRTQNALRDALAEALRQTLREDN
jgi:type I restriction enzyme M protein